jgi:hypothetical protein
MTTNTKPELDESIENMTQKEYDKVYSKTISDAEFQRRAIELVRKPYKKPPEKWRELDPVIVKAIERVKPKGLVIEDGMHYIKNYYMVCPQELPELAGYFN